MRETMWSHDDLVEQRAMTEPDPPEVQAEIEQSIDDQRALVLQRLVDSKAQVLTMDELALAIGCNVIYRPATSSFGQFYREAC